MTNTHASVANQDRSSPVASLCTCVSHHHEHTYHSKFLVSKHIKFVILLVYFCAPTISFVVDEKYFYYT
jgi:hypothetical protein